MFAKSTIPNLNLSTFNTVSVTNIGNMFSNSNINEVIGLTNFDTSNVTTTWSMFENSKFPVIDLSSFDTSNLTSTTNMFKNAAATTGYARTQADADKFNSSSGKPSTLTFTVKN